MSIRPLGDRGTIEEVIAALTEMVEWCRDTESRLGYFAALYRHVTIQVRDRIESGFFDDGDRMERLDVVFANRYLEAVDALHDGAEPTRSWRYAFRSSRQWWPIVLQHLLLGMHAHINLDLGVAAARTVPPDQLPGLRDDFMKINLILADQVDSVQTQLAEIWPALRLFNRYLGSVETALINFSMKKARNHAWSVAERVAEADPDDRERVIRRIDFEVAATARLIRRPGITVSTANRAIRLGERGSIPRKVDILCELTEPSGTRH